MPYLEKCSITVNRQRDGSSVLKANLIFILDTKILADDFRVLAIGEGWKDTGKHKYGKSPCVDVYMETDSLLGVKHHKLALDLVNSSIKDLLDRFNSYNYLVI